MSITSLVTTHELYYKVHKEKQRTLSISLPMGNSTEIITFNPCNLGHYLGLASGVIPLGCYYFQFSMLVLKLLKRETFI